MPQAVPSSHTPGKPSPPTLVAPRRCDRSSGRSAPRLWNMTNPFATSPKDHTETPPVATITRSHSLLMPSGPEPPPQSLLSSPTKDTHREGRLGYPQPPTPPPSPRLPQHKSIRTVHLSAGGDAHQRHGSGCVRSPPTCGEELQGGQVCGGISTASRDDNRLIPRNRSGGIPVIHLVVDAGAGARVSHES